ncbi:MAG: hypothetical protein MHMPM18_000532, partial [Marteilia pararefringens]
VFITPRLIKRCGHVSVILVAAFFEIAFMSLASVFNRFDYRCMEIICALLKYAICDSLLTRLVTPEQYFSDWIQGKFEAKSLDFDISNKKSNVDENIFQDTQIKTRNIQYAEYIK